MSRFLSMFLLSVALSTTAHAEYSNAVATAQQTFEDLDASYGADFSFLAEVASDLESALDYWNATTAADLGADYGSRSVQRGASYYRTRRAIQTIHANIGDFLGQHPEVANGNWESSLADELVDSVSAYLTGLDNELVAEDPAFWSDTLARAQATLGEADDLIWGNQKATKALNAYQAASALYEINLPASAQLTTTRIAARTAYDAGSGSLTTLQPMVNALGKMVSDVIRPEIVSARAVSDAGGEQIDAVIEKLDSVSQCLGLLQSFQLDNNAFAQCYLQMTEVLELLNEVQGALVDTHTWRYLCAYSVYALLDFTIYHSPTSLMNILAQQPSHPSRDLADLSVDEHTLGSAELRTGDLDSAVERYAYNRCRMICCLQPLLGSELW